MRVLHVKNFPEGLHREVRTAAARDGITVREYVIRALGAYVRERDADVAQGQGSICRF